MPPLLPGLSAEHKHLVVESDTASAWGSGGVHVFATPALVGLMESAAVIALRGTPAEGVNSVGTRIDVRHLAPTPVGMQVRAIATLSAVEGRKLTFTIQAWDEAELIGEAVHERYIIELPKFMAKVEKKGKS